MRTHLGCTPTRAAQLPGTGQEVSQGKGKYSRELPKQKWQRARRTGMQTLTMRGPSARQGTQRRREPGSVVALSGATVP